MKIVKTVTISDAKAIELANELAQIEERKPTDSVTRLFVKSARSKLARLKRK